MKRKSIFLCIFILISFFTFVGCQSKSNYGKLYNKDGSLHYEGELKGGVPNGKGKAYDKGILFFEGNFKDGETDLNGYTKTYWDNGKLMFDGYYKDGKRIEGLVYKEDGNLQGYLSYPPISIIGEWVGKDVLTNKEIFYNIKFLENGTFTDSKGKVLGKYNIEVDNGNTSQGTIKMNGKSESDSVNGKITFQSKNQFLITSNSQEVLMFIRKGTDGYNQ